MIHLFPKDDLDLRAGLSLYVHLPFCQHKCFYCDFYSKVSTSTEEQILIIEKIITDAKQLLKHLAINKIETLYIGGGSPSLPPIAHVKKLIELGTQWGATEITIEANPEQISTIWLDTIWASGATRLSVGIQTFHVKSLMAVGRPVSLNAIEEALTLLSPYKDRLNLDLMAGLPGQSLHSLYSDIDRIISFRPAHISFYSLTIEEGTALAQMTHILDSDDHQSLLWQKGKARLNTAGYNDYEISNFSLKGKECLHNQRYWDLKPYIGLGPSAVGNLPINNGGALRITGIKNLEVWRDKKIAHYTVEEIVKDDFIFEHFMMALRSRNGLDKELFYSRFGDCLTAYSHKIDPKWLVEDSRHLALTEQGRLFLNNILQKLL